MKTKIRFIDVFFILGILLMIFSDLFALLSYSFNYIDEILSIISGFLILFTLISYGLNKDKLQLLSILIFFTIFGVICNFVSGIQNNLFVIFIDILSFNKLFIIFIGFDIMLKKNINLKKDLKIIYIILKIYIYILFIFAFLNLFIDLGMSIEERYGIKDFSFIYGIPGIIINHCSYFLIMNFVFKNNNTKLKFSLDSLIGCLVILSTLKTRGFVLCVIFIVLNLYNKYKFKINKKILIASIIALTILVGYSQFEFYFLSGRTVRSLFFTKSFDLANTYFPFGTGFSTYGTGAAATFYSPLYYTLGFSEIYGLTPDNKLFLVDTFWPAILGQFGYFGFLLYLSSFIIFLKQLRNKYGKFHRMILYFFIFDLIFSSVQSAFVTSCSAVCLLVISMSSLHYLDKGDIV